MSSDPCARCIIPRPATHTVNGVHLCNDHMHAAMDDLTHEARVAPMTLAPTPLEVPA